MYVIQALCSLTNVSNILGYCRRFTVSNIRIYNGANKMVRLAIAYEILTNYMSIVYVNKLIRNTIILIPVLW